MINELRAMAIFSKVVELESFRAAAAQLGLSPSVVSHHISKLEQQLGTTLLYRSTRKLSLTDNGRKLFSATQLMLNAAEQGLNIIAERSAEPAGDLALTIPAMFANSNLMDAFAGFAKRFDKVNLSITVSDLAQDLVSNGIDLAVRIGPLKDSSLRSKRLFDMPRTLVASNHLVKRKGEPRHPCELVGWDWIAVQMRPNRKVLSNAEGEQHRLEFQPRITVDSLEAVCRLTSAGLGLSTPPTFMVEKKLAEGSLVEVLPEWNIESLGIYAVWPSNAGRSSLSRRLLEFLGEMRLDLSA